jgi:phage-related minor tail protein
MKVLKQNNKKSSGQNQENEKEDENDERKYRAESDRYQSFGGRLDSFDE